MNEMISSTILLLIIMDPLGNLPIFMSILKHLEIKRRRIVLIREMLIALILMLIFLYSGEHILIFLNLRTETVSISGGIVLFLISFKMIFPVPEEDNNSLNKEDEPFLVPLAIPLIAGPSLLATLMLLAQQYTHKISFLLCCLFIAWLLTLIILLLSNVFLRFLGNKGINALERIMGLILIMIATQMFLDGIRCYLKL